MTPGIHNIANEGLCAFLAGISRVAILGTGGWGYYCIAVDVHTGRIEQLVIAESFAITLRCCKDRFVIIGNRKGALSCEIAQLPEEIVLLVAIQIVGPGAGTHSGFQSCGTNEFTILIDKNRIAIPAVTIAVGHGNDGMN